MKKTKLVKVLTLFFVFSFVSLLSYILLTNEKKDSYNKQFSKISIETQLELILFELPYFRNQLNYFSEKLQTNLVLSDSVRYIEGNIYGYEQVYNSEDEEYKIYKEKKFKIKIEEFEKSIVKKHKTKFTEFIIEKYLSFFEKELNKIDSLIQDINDTDQKNELNFQAVRVKNVINNLKNNHEDFLSVKNYKVVINNVKSKKFNYRREDNLNSNYNEKYIILSSILLGIIFSILIGVFFGKIRIPKMK